MAITSEMKEANKKHLASAIFHLNAAFTQVGKVYGGISLYKLIHETRKKVEEAFKENEPQTT